MNAPNPKSLRLLSAPAILLLAAASSVSQEPRSVPANPSLKLQALDDKVIDLTELRGTVVLVSFGATWCTPCSAELQALEQLRQEYRAQPVKFFWVSIERADQITNAALKRYAKQRNLTFSVLRDTGQAVYLQFTPRVRLPMILLLAKDGRVDSPLQFGMDSRVDNYKANLRARLNKLLNTTIDSDQ
jgi:peroxiredoxin